MEICHRVSTGVCLCVALATPAVSVAQSSPGLAGNTPTAPLDPPVRGSFHNGVGTFYADDTFNGKLPPPSSRVASTRHGKAR
jgi:hypothetical protein